MKAQDLVDFLTKHPDLEVLVSSDTEGSSYRALDEHCMMYVEKSYDGGTLDKSDVMGEEDVAEQLEKVNDDPLDFFKPVIVLWP